MYIPPPPRLPLTGERLTGENSPTSRAISTVDTFQNPNHFWILGSVFEFWDVFWILRRVFGFWEVFFLLRSVFGFWEVFWILERVFSL